MSEDTNKENLELNTQQAHYDFLRTLLESLELEVVKSGKGNKSAGVRLRKNLRLLKSHTQDFIKFTLDKN
tara:strand:+ start:321 stop:530 length:210 start_codon:yes stop_codon:yes gene_type:complete